MRDATLREVLLVKAVEDADPSGRALPLADREAATREALRERTVQASVLSAASAESFLAARARRLFPPLAERHPALAAIASRADLPGWLTGVLLMLAFASGFGLSALDGGRRVDILAVPFLGLVLWNLAVYAGAAALGLRRLSGAGRRSADPADAPASSGYWLRQHVAPRLGRLMVAKPRAAGSLPPGTLSGFARDFGQAAAERLAAQAGRLLHLGAAAVALGLIAGIYLRGSVLQYLAGWESTFLGPSQVQWLIGVLYAPAAALSGLPLPGSPAEVVALAWERGGVPAAPWLHLIALTLGLAVVLPRLLLAAGAQLRSLRFALGTRLPPSLLDYAQALVGEQRTVLPAAAQAERTVNLSLISHTNVGKTTLARTLLHRDVGEVRDAEHVTVEASAYEMLATDEGDLLQLWDTPGFADSVRLADRLSQGGAIGWFLSSVWDRIADREFYLAQRALENVRERADVVLYLVDARTEPQRAADLEPEMRILGWLGKPVVVLLNQLGEPQPPERERADLERWAAHLARYPWVRDTLAFDAFARCWVQEHALADRIGAAVPAPLQAAWSRLATAWRRRNELAFEHSVEVLAAHLAALAGDGETVAARGIAAAAIDWVGKLGRAGEPQSPFDAAMQVLAQRATASLNRTTAELLALHRLGGEVAGQIDARVAAHFSIDAATDPAKASLLGAAVSGALGGLAADLATGGLSLGAGALVGALLGAAGGHGLARAYNLKRGAERSTVRWSPELLDDLAAAAALRYLAVAHYGRGRGDYVESEYPPHWDGAVRARIDAHRTGWHAIWDAAARGEPADAVRVRLRAMCDDLLRQVLRGLYPDAFRPPAPRPPRS
jgi:hypothetical protein